MIPIISKNERAWRIQVSFSGSLPPKKYMTPDIRHNNPGWDSELFNRKIESMEFFIPTGHRLIMAGMEHYNFFIEAVQTFGGKKKKKTRNRTQIKSFWFCGKIPGTNVVDIWKLKVKEEELIHYREYWQHEYNGGPTRGWKRGVPGKIQSIIYEQ